MRAKKVYGKRNCTLNPAIDQIFLDLALHGLQVLHPVSVHDVVHDDDLGPKDELQFLFLALRGPLQGGKPFVIGPQPILEPFGVIDGRFPKLPNKQDGK